MLLRPRVVPDSTPARAGGTGFLVDAGAPQLSGHRRRVGASRPPFRHSPRPRTPRRLARPESSPRWRRWSVRWRGLSSPLALRWSASSPDRVSSRCSTRLATTSGSRETLTRRPHRAPDRQRHRARSRRSRRDALVGCIGRASEVVVLTSAGEKLRARVRGVDDYSGIAVLDLDNPGKTGSRREFVPVVFGDSDGLKIGALVTAFSSPFENPGSAPVYSFGFVSGMGVSQGPARRCSYIKFNAYAPPGAGGGPVLDSSGRLVGMLFGAGGGPRRQAEQLDPMGRAAAARRRTDAHSPHSPQSQCSDRGSSDRRPARSPRSTRRAWLGQPDLDPQIAQTGRFHGRRRGLRGGRAMSCAAVSDQIIRTGGVRRGWVGVKIEESEPGEIKLLGVVPGGPAERAGLIAGDRIVLLQRPGAHHSRPAGGRHLVIRARDQREAGDRSGRQKAQRFDQSRRGA